MILARSGETGIDSSFSHPPTSRLVELGYTFRVGYISAPPASPGKNITLAECNATINAGQKLLLVYEMDAARPNKGATYGAIDGKNAAIKAAALRCPTDVPIIAAADLNTFVANIDTHEAYMRAFAANCAPYPMGIYGDTDILARCAGLWKIGWVPLGAWAWSGTSYANALAKARAVGAHVLQGKGFYIDNIWAVDPNVAIADFPAWGHATQPAPPPTPTEDSDMDVVTNAEAFDATTPAGVVKFAVAYRGQSLYHLSGPEWAAGGSKPGVPMSNVDLDGLAAIPMPTVQPAPPASIDLDALAAKIVALIPPDTAPTEFTVNLTGHATAV